MQAADIKSSKSRTIMLYLAFVLISAVLWCFLTFNNLITIDMPFPVRVIGKPANVRLLTNVPDTITVTVADGTNYKYTPNYATYTVIVKPGGLKGPSVYGKGSDPF